MYLGGISLCQLYFSVLFSNLFVLTKSANFLVKTGNGQNFLVETENEVSIKTYKKSSGTDYATEYFGDDFYKLEESEEPVKRISESEDAPKTNESEIEENTGEKSEDEPIDWLNKCSLTPDKCSETYASETPEKYRTTTDAHMTSSDEHRTTADEHRTTPDKYSTTTYEHMITPEKTY